MSFELNYVDAIPIVSMNGELSRKNARWLDDVIISILSSGQHRIILDFSQLKHIDYKLVEHLSRKVGELRNAGGNIAFAAANPYIVRIFEAMGFREYVYPSVNDALLSISDEAPPQLWQ